MKRKTTKGGGRLGSVRVKKRKSMRSVERRPHRRDRAPRSSDGQSSRSEDDPKRALRDERDREAHAEKHHRPHHHRKHEHSKKKRGQSPALLGLFNIRSKKPRRDRWAEYRPKDNRTLQEDLAVLKAAIGESTVAQPQDEEDVEVPLIFVYFGMCMFMVLGGLMNFKINPDITYVDGSIYFVYVLCSTIGFGDILPDEEYYWFHLIYGLTGVSMFNITVNATLQYMMATLDYLKVVVSKP